MATLRHIDDPVINLALDERQGENERSARGGHVKLCYITIRI